MSDHELLELAAKAAGITGGWGDKIEYHNGAVDLRDVWILEGDDFVPWNPLASDGDALRLAVELRIETEFLAGTVYAGPRKTAKYAVDVSVDQDILSATRRAIVRAAADIVRTK